MKLAFSTIAAALALLALSACASLEAQTGITPEQQTCIITEGTVYATTGVNGWGSMTYVQKSAAVAAGVDAIMVTCAIDSDLLNSARPVISAAIQAAALAE